MLDTMVAVAADIIIEARTIIIIQVIITTIIVNIMVNAFCKDVVQ